VTDLVVAKATEAAIRTITEHERIVLEAEERERLFAALLEPPRPTEAAREGMRRYRDVFGGQRMGVMKRVFLAMGYGELLG
jgi:uncharacterized protein (DUF1778 family)